MKWNIKRAVGWLIENKQWLFSGAGIAFIGLICAFIFRQANKGLPALPANMPAQAGEHSKTGQIPSDVTLRTISRVIDSAAPLAKDKVTTQFIGVPVA
jgi:hypothetical protein